MNKSKLFALVLSTTLILGFLSQNSLAKKKDKSAPVGGQSFNSFGLSPLSYDLKCHDGENITINLRVTNTNNAETFVTIVPMGLVPVEDGLTIKPMASLPENNLSRKITIETPSISVPQNSYKDVSLSINVPSGLKGTQYAGVTAVKTNSQLLKEIDVEREGEFTSSFGVGMQPAIGVTIKCHIQDTLEYDLRVNSVNVKPDNQGVTASAKFDNRGNAEMQFIPFLTLLDSQNKVVARFKAKSISTLYPGTMQTIEFQTLFKDIPAGHYKVIASIPNEEYKIAPITSSVDVK